MGAGQPNYREQADRHRRQASAHPGSATRLCSPARPRALGKRPVSRYIGRPAPAFQAYLSPLLNTRNLQNPIMDPSPGITLATLFADFGMILFALILVLLNGFFVAAEFAMVKLRATRVEAIAHKNGWRGQILRTVHSQLDAYLSACQLGITLASLGLGWVGEPAFAHILEPMLGAVGVQSPEVIKGVSFFAAFFVISYLHIVVGELAP